MEGVDRFLRGGGLRGSMARLPLLRTGAGEIDQPPKISCHACRIGRRARGRFCSRWLGGQRAGRRVAVAGKRGGPVGFVGLAGAADLFGPAYELTGVLEQSDRGMAC